MSQYQEQVDRVARCLARIEKPTSDQTEYVDFLWSFFQNCWHVKDWIKNDQAVPEAVRNNVEKDAKQYDALMICADLCNRSKHLELTTIRKDARLRGDIKVLLSENIPTGESDSTVSWEYVVTLGDGSTRFALDVARTAMDAWKTLLSRYGLNSP